MQDNTTLPKARTLPLDQPWILGLAALLVIQLIVIGVVYWPRNAQTTAGQPLLPGVTADNVTSITVTDNSDLSVQLNKEDGQWVLANSDGFPATQDKVTGLLDKLAALKTDRLVASTAASHPQLEVADDKFVRRIDLTLADGKTATLYVGSAPRANATHVRAGNEDAVYLAGDLSSFDLNARIADWIDATYFSIPAAQVTAVTIDNPNGVFEFSKDGDGNWQLAGLADGETTNSNNFTSMLTTLGVVNMIKPLGKTADSRYGLDDPQATVTVVTTADGTQTTHTLRIGAIDPSTNAFAVASSDSEYYAQVASYTLDRFVQRGRADFVSVPTPEPAGD